MTETNPKRKTQQKGKYCRPKTDTVKAATSESTTRSSEAAVTDVSKRRTTTKKKQHFDLKSLYNKINKNDVKWYWDLKKWAPVLIIIPIILYLIGYNNGKTNQIEYYESLPAETVLVEVIKEVPVEVTEAAPDEEAVALAILADSTGANKSDNVKRILMWVAINRAEDRSNGYGGTLIEEINRPKQWQSYNPEGMYLESTYDIALEVVTTWRNNGPRPIYNDMLWSVFNSDGSITVRNKFKDTKGRREQTFE